MAAAIVMFAVVSTVLLKPLPYGDPDRIVMIWAYLPNLSPGFDAYPIHAGRLDAMRKLEGFAGMDAFKADAFNLTTPAGQTRRLDGLSTSATFFGTMGVTPALGRFFEDGDDAPGRPCVAVIGYGVWTAMFQRDPAIAGAAVRLNGGACTIVGVAPAGFDFPRGGEMPSNFQFPAHTSLWVASRARSGPSEHTVVARLAPGVTLQQAQAHLDALTEELERRTPAARGWMGVRAKPLAVQTVPAETRILVRILFAGALLLVVVSCANAAQILVVRGLARQEEIAIRAALGASRARLAGEAIAESALLAAAAAALAAGLAGNGLSMVRAFGPARFPRLAELSFDWRVTVFALVCAAAVTLVTGLWPALALTRPSAGSLLRGLVRGGIGRGRRVRQLALGAQVALSLLLLVASALLVRSLFARLSADPGFDAGDALTFEMTLPPAAYPEQGRGPLPAIRPRIVSAIDRVLDRLRADPRVRSAAVARPLPLSGAQENTVYVGEGAPPPSREHPPLTEYIVASDGMVDALGARLLYGRDFTSADREASQPVVVVTRAFGQFLWRRDDVVGRRVKLGGRIDSPAPFLTIVGVVDDIKRYSLTEEALPTMFVPYPQGPYAALGTVSFVVRPKSGDPIQLADLAREAVRGVDPEIPIAAVQPLAAIVAHVSDDARFAGLLMLGFAAAALLLCVVGLYGTVAVAVTRRAPEIGIRLALGATPGAVVRLVLADGLAPAAAGIAGGLFVAFASMRVLASLLFGVSARDVTTYAAVAIGVAIVALASCVTPAARAARIDPRRAMNAG